MKTDFIVGCEFWGRRSEFQLDCSRRFPGVGVIGKRNFGCFFYCSGVPAMEMPWCV